MVRPSAGSQYNRDLSRLDIHYFRICRVEMPGLAGPRFRREGLSRLAKTGKICEERTFATSQERPQNREEGHSETHYQYGRHKQNGQD
jgi:hypothetical protein